MLASCDFGRLPARAPPQDFRKLTDDEKLVHFTALLKKYQVHSCRRKR